MPILKDIKKAEKKIEDISSRFDLSKRKKEHKTVEEIIDNVRKNGDKALISYTKKFDKITLSEIKVSTTEINKSNLNISKKLLTSIRNAIARIRAFQKTNTPQTWIKTFSNNEKLGYKYIPVDSVGIYIPGGKIPLISTVLMTAIPAQVAGVKRVAVFTPPPIHPGILASCKLLGIKEVYKVGGAQAIAAAAYGTKSVEPVDKIVGPGNIFVTLAKKSVFGKVGIDGLYGPSEIAIIADSTANPGHVACDLLSQLEHGSGLESALLVTNSEKLASETQKVLLELADDLPNKKVVLNSWKENSAIVVVKSLNQAVNLVNKFAPEHLEIITKNATTLAKSIKHAGAIFIGEYTCESVGDYVAGPSHCLPTGGSAKFSSGLTVMDFMKKTSIVSFNKQSLSKVSKDIIELAEAESLPAHANAVRVRL